MRTHRALRWGGICGAQKEAGAASLAPSEAGTRSWLDVWLRVAQPKKAIWTTAERAFRKPVGPLTEPSYLASNQLNVKILQAFLSEMLIPPEEVCDV